MQARLKFYIGDRRTRTHSQDNDNEIRDLMSVMTTVLHGHYAVEHGGHEAIFEIECGAVRDATVGGLQWYSRCYQLNPHG